MTEEEKTLLIKIAERLENFEKRMDDKFEVINESLKRDYKIIYGNGQPGLIQQVQELSLGSKALKEKLDALEDIPKRVQTLENFHKNESGFMKKYGGALAWLVTTALAICSLVMHK